MIHKIVALGFVGALTAAAPNAGEADEPRARAWAVRIAMTAVTPEVESLAGQDIVRAAEVSSDSGATPNAFGVPLTIAGQGTDAVTATPENPDEVSAPFDWDDPTGSMSLEGGFAEAHATDASASARAGLNSVSGSGFAMANELFTYEQQEQMLTQWSELNATIFGPLNDGLGALDPVLGAVGLDGLALEPIAPTGLIDIAKGRGIASAVETGSSPGFSSARADTTLGEIRLFGGFIDARGVSAEAISESVAGDDTRKAIARIGSLSIAGVPVEADGDGFRVTGTDVVSRSVVQPALDTLLGGLRAAGVTIRAFERVSRGDLQEAVALEVEIASPGGTMLISLGHAEASAASVGALPPQPAPPAGDPEPPTGARVPPEEILPGSPVTAGPIPPSTPAVTAPGSSVDRRLGPAAARALRTAYLLFLVAGMIASLAFPMLVRAPPSPVRLKGALR